MDRIQDVCELEWKKLLFHRLLKWNVGKSHSSISSSYDLPPVNIADIFISHDLLDMFQNIIYTQYHVKIMAVIR